MSKPTQCYLHLPNPTASLGTERRRTEMAQAAKELVGVFRSSPLKQIMHLISNPGKLLVTRSESIMAMEGTECRRFERAPGGQGSDPAEGSVTPGSPR